MEANPKSYASPRQAAALDHLFESGVNRAPAYITLAIIGRRPSGGPRPPHDSIPPNRDLMTGRPDRPCGTFRQTCLSTDLPVDHLSSYALALAPDTLLAEKYRADPDLSPTMTGTRHRPWVKAYLESCGFDHYEISNFAKAGARSRHILFYCRADSIWQPAGRIGYMGACARSNPGQASVTERVPIVRRDPSPASVEERIDKRRPGLRPGLGCASWMGAAGSFHSASRLHSIRFSDSLDRLSARCLVTLDPHGVRLTGKGLDLAELVARELI